MLYPTSFQTIRPLRKIKMKNRMKTSINRCLILLVPLIVVCASLFMVGVPPVRANPAIYWVEAGAVGDGTLEGTPAGNITWVINDQPGRAWNITAGDVIKVKPGTYNDTIEDFPLTISVTDLTIESTGTTQETIIDATGAGGVNIFEIDGDMHNTTINGFKIISDGIQIHGIYSTGVSAENITIRNNYITGLKEGGIVLQSGDRSIIEDNNITSNGYWGIYLYSAAEGLVRNNIINGNGADNPGADGGGIKLEASDSSNLNITGNTIEDNDKNGIYFSQAFSGTVIHNNNIQGNTQYGIRNDNSPTVDATLNWWGDISGPGGAGGGAGDHVSSNVDYSPWLDSLYPGGSAIGGTGKSQAISGSGTLDARSEADTTVTVTGSGNVEVGAVKYSRNPTGSSFSGDIGKYFDVNINTTAGVTSLTLRFFYTDADIAGKTESLLKMHWWNGGTWRLCNPQTIYMDAVDGYSGYIEVNVTATSTPTLSQLVGTPFGIGEEPKPVGGIVIDNDFEFFAPWIGIAALAIAAIVTATFAIKKRKH